MIVAAHHCKALRHGILMALLATAVSLVSAKENSSSLFHSKCAPCHGRNAESNSSTKAPSLFSDKVKRMSDGDIRSLIISRANGEMERSAGHTQLKKRLSEEQITELIAYIRRLQSGGSK